MTIPEIQGVAAIIIGVGSPLVAVIAMLANVRTSVMRIEKTVNGNGVPGLVQRTEQVEKDVGVLRALHDAQHASCK